MLQSYLFCFWSSCYTDEKIRMLCEVSFNSFLFSVTKFYYLNLLLSWSSNCFAVTACNLLPLQSIVSNFKTLIPDCHPLVQIFFYSCQVFFGLSVCLFSQWDIPSMIICAGWLSARCKMRPVNVMCLFLTRHRDLWTLHSLVYLLLTSLWFCEESWDCTYLEDW